MSRSQGRQLARVERAIFCFGESSLHTDTHAWAAVVCSVLFVVRGAMVGGRLTREAVVGTGSSSGGIDTGGIDSGGGGTDGNPNIILAETMQGGHLGWTGRYL
jgi:hypothetical protein